MNGLDGVRGDLERQPRDPFKVGDPDAALEALAAEWGSIYNLGYDGVRWRACRRDGTGVTLTCETPDELAVAMRAAWGTR